MEKTPDQADLLKQAVEVKKETEELKSLSSKRIKRFTSHREMHKAENGNPLLLESLINKSDKGGKGR